MEVDQELESFANPAMGQFFLVAADKIRLVIDAAGIRLSDRVVELGAGAGTISRHIPRCRSLTLVELDERLIPLIRRNAPDIATVVNGEGLQLARDLPCEVLISNMPNSVTESLFEILPSLRFRTAVVAVGEHSGLSGLEDEFEVSEIARVTGADFRPPQHTVSRIVRLWRRGTQPSATSTK